MRSGVHKAVTSGSAGGTPAATATKDYLRFALIRGDHETFNRLARHESFHNLWDVGSRNASVKKVIGFD